VHASGKLVVINHLLCLPRHALLATCFALKTVGHSLHCCCHLCNSLLQLAQVEMRASAM